MNASETKRLGDDSREYLDGPSNEASLKRYLINGGIWAVIGKVLTVSLGLALSALLARLFTPEDMGTYFLAFNLATFFSIFAGFGLENTLLRFISEAIGRNEVDIIRGIIRKGLVITLVASVVVSGSVYAGMGRWIAKHVFDSRSLTTVIGFVSIWLITLGFQLIFSEIFRAFQDIRNSVLFGGLVTVTFTVITLSFCWLVYGRMTLLDVFPWILAAGVLNIVCAFLILGRKTRVFRLPEIRRIRYTEILHHSWPLFVNTLTFFILAKSDIWILAAFRTEEEVALYGAAARLVMLVSLALSMVNSVVPPMIAKLNVKHQKEKLQNILRATATLAALPALSVLVLFVFFGDVVLEVVFGGYYKDGAMILVILSVGQAISVFVGSCGYTLIMTGHRKTIMMISLLSAIVGVSGGLVFVQRHGAMGVAFAMSASMVMQQLLMLGCARYKCGVWTHIGMRYLKLSLLR